MGNTEPPIISARAWIELLHAEVGYLLGQAGIPVLHIKGPTVARWLYPDGGRQWGDVDVLVPPSHMHDALAVLAEFGFAERFAGVNRHTTEDHAVTVSRLDPELGTDEVDVHDRFPGIDSDPESAFAELWSRREPDDLAHTAVWFPDLATRAVLVVLNTARSPESAQAREDLARLTDPAAGIDWPAVVALAARVGATPALRAGLELTEAGGRIVAETRLHEVAVSTEWSMRVAGAPRTALRLDELSRLPPAARLRQVVRWLLPAPGVVRMRDPRAAAGRRALVSAYLRRFGDGARSLPPALQAWRRARRQHDTKGCTGNGAHFPT